MGWFGQDHGLFGCCQGVWWEGTVRSLSGVNIWSVMEGGSVWRSSRSNLRGISSLLGMDVAFKLMWDTLFPLQGSRDGWGVDRAEFWWGPEPCPSLASPLSRLPRWILRSTLRETLSTSDLLLTQPPGLVQWKEAGSWQSHHVEFGFECLELWVKWSLGSSSGQRQRTGRRFGENKSN